MRHLDLSRFKNASSLSSGRHSAIFSGSGIEFRELREYREGNDLRSIDWKSSLRSGKTLSKSYVPDHEIPVWIVLDVSSSMGYGPPGARPIDTALTAFDLIVASARRHGNSIGAIAFSDHTIFQLSPSRSVSQTLSFRRMVETTISSRTDPDFSTKFPLKTIRSHIRSKSVVFILSDRIYDFPSLNFEQNFKRPHCFFLRIRHPIEDSIIETDIATFREGEGFSFGKSNPSWKDAPYTKGILEIPSGSDPYLALHSLLSSHA